MYKILPHLALSLLLLPSLLWLTPTKGITFAELEFDTPEQEQQFKDLIAELRCLVCQNQSLADSDADLAQDLRKEVYEMMRQGKGNKEITDFLVARYGDFVLYRPPLKLSTLMLWFTPIAFAIIALIVLWKNLRKQPSRNTSLPLDSEEQAQITKLLKEHGDVNKNDKGDQA